VEVVVTTVQEVQEVELVVIETPMLLKLLEIILQQKLL
jgi:hypothetical protein